ncbi:TPA: hypothetical protein QDZ23_002050 [Pseudomonas putida]|nr:hypothetical protein [Pseudomonas putida]
MNIASASSKLQTYIDKQEQQLIKAINSPARYPTGVIGPEDLIGRIKTKLTFEYDPKVANNMAFILTRTESGEKEYWTHVKLGPYRKHFLRFLSDHYGVPTAEVDSNWHADHMFNKAYALKNDIAYIRMCLIPARQNTSYGSKLEKKILTITQGKREIYLMSYLQILKILDVPIPKSKQDYNDRKIEIGKLLMSKGISGFELAPPERFMDIYFKFYDIL